MMMSFLRHNKRRIKSRRAPSSGPTKLGPSGRLVLGSIFTIIKLKTLFCWRLIVNKDWQLLPLLAGFVTSPVLYHTGSSYAIHVTCVDSLHVLLWCIADVV